MTTQIVKIPYMERESFHRVYADALLALALELSEDKFGPYVIVQEDKNTVIRRQLLELEKGDSLSVAVSMPMPDWLASARVVQFPVMKGLASYRMFFLNSKNSLDPSKLLDLATLKQIPIGQGPGWSTGKILEDNGFKVVYGGPHETLLPMLKFRRFDLLMRSVYEIGPELTFNRLAMPELEVVNSVAVFTYLPMYFFVSNKEPVLARRLEYGLQEAYLRGKLDRLYQRYFGPAVRLLNEKNRSVFYLKNTNIDNSYFEHDKPYLLNTIRSLGEKSSVEKAF